MKILHSLKPNIIQEQIYKELKQTLAPYEFEIVDAIKWASIISSLGILFQDFMVESKILKTKEICNNFCSDYILEYDINFSEGWFLYCHLRNGHLMLKFVPKEFS